MQILRRLLLACVVAAFVSPLLLHAYDNEAQLRARQALDEKMKELNAEQSVTSAPPAMMTKPEAAPAKPAAAKPAKPVTPAPEMQPAPSEAAQQPETAQPAPAATSPMAMQSTPSAGPVYSAPPSTSSNEEEQSLKLREAMRAKMQQQEGSSAGTNAPGPAIEPWNQPYSPPQHHHVAPTAPPTKQPAPSLPPLSAPPTGLSAAKQQKLDQLLQLYRADQITPEEYHEQRAKILAEP